jgi:hypothetical protein
VTRQGQSARSAICQPRGTVSQPSFTTPRCWAAAFLRGFVSHLCAHQGLARTLATLMATRSGALTEGSEALTQAIGELLAAAAEDGTIRDDVGVGPVMMALHGISAAYDRPGAPVDADGVISPVLDGLRHRPPATA